MNKFLIGGIAAAAAAPLLAQVAPTPPAPPAPPAPPIARVAPTPPVLPMPPIAMRTFTRTEVQAKIAKHFARIDANHDGFVTEQEMTELHGRFDRMKTMGKDIELRRDPNAAFDRMDGNRDGMISRDEFARGHEVRVERIVMRDGPDGAAGGEHPMGMHMEGRHMGMMIGDGMLKMADSNRDGRVSLQEATTLALQHFDKADTNRDGRLTPDEMRDGHMKMREIRIQQRAG